MDLSYLDDEYARAEAPDRAANVPDGTYQVKVESVALKATQKTGDPMLAWKLKILGPRCAGRFLFKNHMMVTPENLKWLKGDLECAGLALNRLSELKANLGQLLDVTLEVVQKSNGQYTNLHFNRRVQLDEDGSTTDEGAF